MTDLFWLDDMRTAPDNWDWAETYNSAVAKLSQKDYRHGSLDHDLFEYWGYDSAYYWKSYGNERTGLDVLEYIIDNDRWPSQSLSIHTDVTHKREEMADLIEWYGPYSNRAWYERFDCPNPVKGYIFWNDERPDDLGLFTWEKAVVGYKSYPYASGYSFL